MTPEDTRRQEATTNCLLDASAPLNERREVQLLADEVGLGKTFVALATAYSLLRTVRRQPQLADEAGLGKCYRSVIVVVPSGNHALAHKWKQEVEAIQMRCSTNPNETSWFHSRICDNAYDLVEPSAARKKMSWPKFRENAVAAQIRLQSTSPEAINHRREMRSTT